MINKEDFYLLDLVGGTKVSVLHPTRPVIAYSCGCMIIVYDLLSDAKIQLSNHAHEVQEIVFSSGTSGAECGEAQGDVLVSIDYDRQSGTSNLNLW